MEWKEKKRQRRRKKEKKEPDDPGITLLSYQFPQHIGIKCKKIKIKTKKKQTKDVDSTPKRVTKNGAFTSFVFF